MERIYGINFGAIHKKTLSECEISQALVMINMHVKFNVHSSYTKQVIVLKVEDRRTCLVTTIGIRQKLG